MALEDAIDAVDQQKSLPPSDRAEIVSSIRIRAADIWMRTLHDPIHAKRHLIALIRAFPDHRTSKFARERLKAIPGALDEI
jgi:hypothetical protein